MPRQGRGSAAPRRSAPAPAPARPSAPAPAPQQHRPATTAAHPPQQQHQQPHPPAAQAPAASQGPGLFGQMASTAAGVAVGSSIGHAIGGFFGGGSSAPAEAAPQAPAAGASEYQQQAPKVCENDVNAFKQCMDQNEGSLTICGWYLDQLKACQQAASRY